MYQKDFTDYQFRASSLGSLVDTFIKNEYSDPLTAKQRESYNDLKAKNSKSKTLLELENKIFEKENRKHLELEEATKTKLYEIWLEESLSIREFTGSKDTKRGDKYEQMSIDMLNKVYNQNFTKNDKREFNEILQGEADVVSNQSILDIKTKSKFTTFDKSNQTTADSHFWQLWAYKQLYKKELSYIAFCLPSYDDDDIFLKQQQETKGLELEEIEKIKKQIELNMNFDRIPEKARVKLFKVDTLYLPDGTTKKDTEIESNLVYEYLQQCRAYLNGITKNNKQYFKN
jgi:hypothetical protein